MNKETLRKIRKSSAFTVILALFGGFLFYMLLTAATYPDKEMQLWREKRDIEDKIDRVEEAIRKNWFPDGDDQVVLLEAKRILDEKLSSAKARYEEERKQKVSEIAKETKR